MRTGGAKRNAPHLSMRGESDSSLTMSYFHTGTRTIIGAEAFHCPVRDGKEWDHLAMVIRLNRMLDCFWGSSANSQSRLGVLLHTGIRFLIAHRLHSKSGTTCITQSDSQVKVIGSSLTGN